MYFERAPATRRAPCLARALAAGLAQRRDRLTRMHATASPTLRLQRVLIARSVLVFEPQNVVVHTSVDKYVVFYILVGLAFDLRTPVITAIVVILSSHGIAVSR